MRLTMWDADDGFFHGRTITTEMVTPGIISVLALDSVQYRTEHKLFSTRVIRVEKLIRYVNHRCGGGWFKVDVPPIIREMVESKYFSINLK